MSDLADLVPIPPKQLMNPNLSSASEKTMLQKFGKPGELSKDCSKPDEAFKEKYLVYDVDVGPFKVKGLRAAVESLKQVFAEVKRQFPQVFQEVRTDGLGMLCVRHKRPNPASYSNHSWGTAIDLKFGPKEVDQGTHQTQRGFLSLYPIFNQFGWYWGAEFSGGTVDSMHFEWSEESINKLPGIGAHGAVHQLGGIIGNAMADHPDQKTALALLESIREELPQHSGHESGGRKAKKAAKASAKLLEAHAADDNQLGRPAVDSSAEVLHQVKGKTLLEWAEDLYGEPPLLWGRYFKDKDHVGGVHYNAAHESAALAGKNIRLLPIAQQTDRVSMGKAEGTADAALNVAALFAAFSLDFLAQQGGEFYFYLDVEGSPAPSLTSGYYQGWSQAIIDQSRQHSNNKVTLLPSLYCNMDQGTWQALQDAASHGAKCYSAWLARWFTDDQVCAPLRPWNKAHVMPHPAPPCPVHLWQYAKECKGGDGIDMDMTNPYESLDDYLARLIKTG